MSFLVRRVAMATMMVTFAAADSAQSAGMTTDRDGNTGYATIF